MSQRRWWLLLVVFCVCVSPAFGQTVEFLDAQGDSLSGPYFEGSMAYLRVVDPAVSNSIVVQVAASMSGDVETVWLGETGAGTGVFEGSIELSIWTPAPADGRLQTSRDASHYPYTFDSVTATYGAASDTANMIGSTVEITDATGNPAETFLVGDRLYFRVMDAAANSSTWIAETTYVIVHATVGNWEEYETPTVTETGPDTSIFEGSIQTVLGGDPVTEDGIFELAPGDLAEVQHLDANGQTDSFDQAGALSSLPVTIEWVDEFGQPLSQVYEFSSPSVRVTDGALAGLGSLSVRLTSDLRGDEEWLTLWEDSSNPGVFSREIYLPGTSLPDPPAQDGWLEVTENPGPPLQRDTVRAFHESCSTPPCPTVAAPMIGTTTRLTDSQWSDVEMAIPGSPIFIEVIDYSRPYELSTTATIASQAGDSEIVSLDSAYDDPYQPRYDAFRGSIDVEVGPVVQGDGVLQVQEPDTITASYPDPFHFSFSTDSAVVVAATMIEFLDRFGNPADYQFEDSPVRVRAVYPDGNTDPGAADAVTVTLLTKDSDGNTRDTETLQLTETGPDTGIFSGQINHLAYYQTYPENGTLESWYTYNGPGTPSLADSVTVVLDSASATVPFLFSKVWFIDAAGNEATQYSLGERIYMRAERENANNSPLQANYLWIQVSSLTTGDFESVTLTETGPDTAVFEGWIYSAERPAEWDNILGVQVGETIELIHQGYLIQVKDQAVIIANQPPVAGDDTATLAEDTSVSIPVLANDSDPENVPLGLHRIETNPAHGTVEMEPNGSILYTPAWNYYGTDSFQYRVHDGVNSVVGTVTITISPVNDRPDPLEIWETTLEDTVHSFPFQGSDPDNEPVFLLSFTSPERGLLSLEPDGVTFVYTPEPNFNGAVSFTYTTQDAAGETTPSLAHITVQPVADSPIAVDDTATTAEDTVVSIHVRDNDSDGDGDMIWISDVTQGAHGQVGADALSINYLSAANYNGTDSFTYTINDGNGHYATATVTVTITPTDDPPSAVVDNVSATEDTPLTLNPLANDSDPDGHVISLVAVTQAFHGSVVINANGSVTYTPEPNYDDIDRFDYTIQDSTGSSATARVNITVTPVNDPPVAVDDSVTMSEDTATAIYERSNDSDPDGDALTVSGFTQGAHGAVALQSGLLRYTPAAHYNGTDTFTYTVRDWDGATDTATITVTITPVWDAPSAGNDSAVTAEDSAVTVDVLANDSDVDGDTLSVVAVTQGANGSVAFNASSVVYTPAANFNGADSFTYTVTDGTGISVTATVSISVTPVNDAPVAVDESVTTSEDSAVTVNALANDTDADGDALIISSYTLGGGANGTVTLNPDKTLTYTPAPNYYTPPGTPGYIMYRVSDGTDEDIGYVHLNVTPINDPPTAQDDSAVTAEDNQVWIAVLDNDSDVENQPLMVTAVTQGANGTVTRDPGSVTYTPAADFNGTDSFTYTVSDSDGGTATATVTVTVDAVADPPEAADDAATTNEDTAVGISILSNDRDRDGDTLSISSVTQPSFGAVTINADLTVTYTPQADYNGLDTFTYTISDGDGGSATARVDVTVSGVNDPPVAVDDSMILDEDTYFTTDVLGNDSDVDGGPVSRSVTAVTQGAHGNVAINADNTVTYTAAANYNGSDSFTYTVSDGIGTDTATVGVTINPRNDAPVAANDSGATNEDSAVMVDVLANDSDLDGDSLSITDASPGSNGSVTFTAGSVTYTPAANFNGADSFTYTISDGNGSSATATVAITVSSANDNPVAGNDSGNTNEDTAVSIDVQSNDSDLDGDTLSITAVTQGARGSATFTASSVTYTPAANANGSDSFTYTVSDGKGGTATASVAITINAVNDAPDAVNDAAATNEDAAVTISVLANDADVDGEAVTLIGVTQGSRGSVAQNGNGTVTYTPNPNTFGADAFTYTIRDAAGLTDTATVTVNVAPVNDSPDAINDSATTNEGGGVVIIVLANDTDIEGNALSVIAISTPAHGTATITGNAITYTPVSTYSGADSFTYTMSDGAATDTATVTVQVKDVIGNVAVLGTHSVWIQTGADVLSGDVIANAAGSAPFLNSTEVSISGSGASTATGWDVQGNRVTVASGASLASDVYYNQLSNSGTVSGAQYTPLSLPVFATLPAFLSASPGSSDVNVANNGTRTLAAGSYRDLIVGRKATVTFTGGTYHFRSIQVDREAKLFFSGGSQVRVQQKMSTNTLTTIGPSSGSSVTAASIVFYVAGINGTSGTLSATPKAVEIGTDNTVSANLYAPDGTLWLKDRAQATGSFLGRDVQIGVNGQVSLRSAW